MSRIEDGGAVEAGLVDIAEELTSFAYCVDGEVGNGSFAVYDKAGVDSGAIARNLRAVLREAAAEITRLRAENAGMREALSSARETILDLKNARWSEAEGTDEEWVAEIDAALSKASQAEGQTR